MKEIREDEWFTEEEEREFCEWVCDNLRYEDGLIDYCGCEDEFEDEYEYEDEEDNGDYW
ncbi:MAG: hypothetical protein QXV82_09005 [Ignisphaera sp.]